MQPWHEQIRFRLCDASVGDHQYGRRRHTVRKRFAQYWPRIGDIRAKVMAEIDFFSKLDVDQVCANPKEGIEGG